MERIFRIPLWVNGLLTRHQHRWLKILLLILVFLTALYTKSYKGEHQQLINNHVGGVLYVLFGSLTFSALFPNLKVYWVVVTAFVITSILEFVQWLRIPFMVELTKIKTFAYLFGNSYNPADFIYYAIGALSGLLLLALIGYGKKTEDSAADHLTSG
jgi:hypothetical protein